MTPEKLFEEKQHLVFAAIKQQFNSHANAEQIAKKNYMDFDDLVQIGRIKLWELCLNYDPEKESTFNAYVMMTLKWKIRNEVHTKGMTIKIPRSVDYEERNTLCFHSIDLHTEDDTENDFFAVSPINVEEEALLSVEFEEVTSVLGEKEKSIILHVGEGYTTREIARKFEMGESTVKKKKNAAFLKINPNYKPLNLRSFFLGKRSFKGNRQQPLAI
ncbi:sigma-70 family RNA polymerase sigma factor [Bacillus thuringiensis]|uniref:RNA polymerase subunit sigma n=1 Tax=Bacillus thuringiensis subsp. higo TaxID=132266 RepID=A0A9X6QP44_BACUH|nr:sigma-70 family RNA polymerase sigma factor [Bacillus thuringiensis]OUB48229.1 RNA polymerase subunit sigma [Bacillus thuringiensis serovar higo]